MVDIICSPLLTNQPMFGTSVSTGPPVVPLSRDKEIFLSQCPFVPRQGQEQKSQDKLLCPGTKLIYIYLIALKIFRKNDKISCCRTSFRTSFACFRTYFPVLECPFLFLKRPFPALEHPLLLCPVLSR